MGVICLLRISFMALHFDSYAVMLMFVLLYIISTNGHLILELSKAYPILLIRIEHEIKWVWTKIFNPFN